MTADAVVLAVAEPYVSRRAPGDVEAIGIGKLALVAVGRLQQQEHPLAGAKLRTVDLDRLLGGR